MSKSTTTKHAKPEKPYPEFPLSAHPCGQWVKKIKGTLYYCGPWADPTAALEKYRKNVDDWQAGRKPRPQPETTTDSSGQTVVLGPAIHDLVNQFYTAKSDAVDNSELVPRTLAMYKRCGQNLGAYFGRNRQIADLRAEDFQELRVHLARGRSLLSFMNELRAVRVIFSWGWKSGLLNHTDHNAVSNERLSELLKPPPKKALRAEKNSKPSRMLEAADLRRIVAAAGIPLRAMILIGINGGFGQGDISALPEAALNLKSGWLDFARIKTAVQRRVPLWPETVEAIKAALAKRPAARTEDAQGKLFVTKYGSVFVRSNEKGTQIDSIALEFGKLLGDVGLKVAKAKGQAQQGKGLNFYALRHTFETIAGDTRDQVAVDFLMGHTPAASDMAAVYRKRLNDSRLVDVTDFVRKWLWPEGSEAAWLEAEKQRAENAEKRTDKAADE